jgi:hypothetical protein
MAGYERRAIDFAARVGLIPRCGMRRCGSGTGPTHEWHVDLRKVPLANDIYKNASLA